MASEAQARAQISAAVHIFEEFRKWAGVATPNYISLESALTTILNTSFAGECTGALASARSNLDTFIQQVANVLAPLVREYGITIGATEADVQSIMTRLFDRFEAGPYTVQSRNFTYGSPAAAGGNVGNGLVYRLNKDRIATGNNIENCTAELKTAKCVADAYSGAAIHEESLEFRGVAPERDLLKIVGSGKSGIISALSARSAQTYINNPSFDQYSGTLAVPTAITDWTPNSGVYTAFEIDQTNFYRSFYGASNPGALKIKGNDKVVQKFTVRNLQWNPNLPLFARIAYNREVGTGDGTLTLKIGSISASVVLAAQTGWNMLTWPGDGSGGVLMDYRAWHKNWNTTNPGIEVQLAGRTTGSVLVDDLIISPYANFDGLWYSVVGGSTPFLRNDSLSWTDSEVGSVLQYFFWLAFGRYLPSTTGAPSWTDP